MADARPLRSRIGDRGEDVACAHLSARGYEIVDRRFRTREGEVDIIARDGETTVFVEVKTRSGQTFGGPLDAVTPTKQARCCRAAMAYLQANDLWDAARRFDVIGIVTGDGEPTITHIENAFSCGDGL